MKLIIGIMFVALVSVAVAKDNTQTFSGTGSIDLGHGNMYSGACQLKLGPSDFEPNSLCIEVLVRDFTAFSQCYINSSDGINYVDVIQDTQSVPHIQIAGTASFKKDKIYAQVKGRELFKYILSIDMNNGVPVSLNSKGRYLGVVNASCNF